MNVSIAIDGPAGAGKSTIARRLAMQTGYTYVDTGAMYRAMALYFIRNRIMAGEEEKIEAACRDVKVTIAYEKGEQRVLLGEENVNGFLRTEEVGNMASAVAKSKAVRLKLVELQRALAQTASVVMDGRDIGTYVLPDADVKIYLTAGSRERAGRRFKELQDKGIACNIEEIEQDIIVRDEQDMSRDFAPLRQAEDAVLLDSSHMDIDEVVAAILEIFDHRKAKP